MTEKQKQLVEEYLAQLPPETQDMARQQAENAIKFNDLVAGLNGTFVQAMKIGTQSGEMVVLVTTPRPVSAKVAEELQAVCPFPLEFRMGVKPMTFQMLNMIDAQSHGLIRHAVGQHRECTRNFQVAWVCPEEVVADELKEMLAGATDDVLRRDGFPEQWTVTLNGEIIYETKAPEITDADIEAIKAIESVDDIINS